MLEATEAVPLSSLLRISGSETQGLEGGAFVDVCLSSRYDTCEVINDETTSVLFAYYGTSNK